MPKLTRTQKYAGLREQLANDKEEIISSKDLSSYQDRFNAVQETLAPSQEKEPEIQEDVWQPFVPVDQPAVEENSWQEIKEVPVEEAPAFEQPVVEETPIVEEQPAFEAPTFEQPAVEETLAVEEQPAFETPVFEQPVVEEVPAFEQPVVEEEKQEGEAFKTFEENNAVEPDNKEENTSSYFDNFISQTSQTEEKVTDFSSFFEDNKEEIKPSVDEVVENVFEDVKDNSGEIISIKERESYLNQTFSDVDKYNSLNGENTINSTIDNLVDEVRHPGEKPVEEAEIVDATENQEPADNTYAWTPFTEKELDADAVEAPEMDDEEFSNTVSLEISKIMGEIANAPKQEVEFEEVKAEEEVSEPVEEVQTEVQEETIQINETVPEEKPEEVVEIKNISEIDNEPEVKDTMSTTIPFVVAAEDEEEDVEEEEEDGSNTVLNVILIVLIVVLVAVLGLIVFYILKTKGFFN